MTPTTFTISSHSLGIYDRCPRAYWLYRIKGRRAVRSQAGLIAGTAMHAAIHRLNCGASQAEQEMAIQETLVESPIPSDDYRTLGYLRDALAAFRAEFVGLFAGWIIHEVEAHGTVELGDIIVRGEPVKVLWEFRRDLVGTDPDGLILVVDYKTASRNEDVEYLAMKNSGQLMGYCRSYQLQHGKAVHGALPVRIIMRKPSRTGVTFEFPKDSPIFFQPERLDEWQRQTLFKVRSLLERDPNDPEQWPLASNPVGSCRHHWGACEFLPVCSMAPQDRLRMLDSDAYESSDHANHTAH